MVFIGVLIDDMFEEVEYTSPVKAFKKANHSIIHMGCMKENQSGVKRKAPWLRLINHLKTLQPVISMPF